MLKALRKALNSMRPKLPLQLTDDFMRLETLVDVLENASQQQVEILGPLLMQHTAALFQEFMRLVFIEDMFPIFARMMTGAFGSVEEEAETGFAELEKFLQQHGGETN